MKRILAPALALLLLGGCVSNGTGPNQTMGTLVGAAAGGLAGSQFGSGNGRLAATAAGTLLGAYAGNQWGAAVDQNNEPDPLRTGSATPASGPAIAAPTAADSAMATGAAIPTATTTDTARDTTTAITEY